MKKIILLLMAVFSLSAYAQEPFVLWGDPISKSEPPTRIHEIFQLENSGFYALRKAGPGHPVSLVQYLDKYSSSFNRIFGKMIPLHDGRGEDLLTLQNILPMKNKIAVFYVGYRKTAKENFLVMRTMLSDGEMESGRIELESIPVRGRFNSSSFRTAMSPDNSKMLLVTTFPMGRGINYRVRLKAFDAENMQEIWQKEIEMNFDSRNGEVLQFLIDNAGNAYLTGRYFAEDKSINYFLWTYSALSSAWNENTLNLQGRKISDSEQRLIFDAKGDVVFAGFLYEGFEKEAFRRIFFLKVNGQTQELEPLSQMGFGNTASGENEYVPFARWKLRAVLPQLNGNILVIGENEAESRVTRNINPPGSTATSGYAYQNHSKEIKVLSITPSGTRNWLTTIFKDQKAITNDPTSITNSFIYTLVNDRLFIVYNNLSLAQARTQTQALAWLWTEVDGRTHSIKDFAQRTETPTFLYIVEPDGRPIYDDRRFGLPLFDFQKNVPYPMTLNSYVFLPLNDGIIMMQESTGRFQFGKIHF